MNKIISILVTIGLLIALAVPALAALPEDSVVSPMYTYIDSNSVRLSIDRTTGIATCQAVCFIRNASSVSVKCELQKYMGTYWATVKTWSASGSSSASINGNWAVQSGYTYRNYATFRVYNSVGIVIETGSSYKTATYPGS